MSILFEELDYQETPLGAISLRRRADPRLGGEMVYEVKLGDEFLMSSRFTVSETQLAKLGLAALDGTGWDVVVGGLGLGYTASAALEFASVESLIVIELLRPVIEWHQKGLVPLGRSLPSDPRCALVQGDFFQWATSDGDGVGGKGPTRRVHAILLDIDHSPSHWLAAENGTVYSEDGLRCLASKLHSKGVFALWSNDPPDDRFIRRLQAVFALCEAHVVSFPNPYMGGDSASTIYVAQTASGDAGRSRA